MKIINLKCNLRTNPLGVSVNPCFSWCYDTDYIRGKKQSGYRLIVSSSQSFNEAEIEYDSGKILSDKTNGIYAKEFEESKKYYWRIVSYDQNGVEYISDIAEFETALKDNFNCNKNGAYFINSGMPTEEEPATLIFFKNFNVASDIKRARAYVFGLGWQSVYINDNICSDAVLSPPNTSYNKRCLYETYDITSFLCSGINKIDIILGGGYSSAYSKYGWRWEKSKCTIALVMLEYLNGEKEWIPTDSSWKFKESQIRSCNIYNGEVYDGRYNPNQTVKNAAITPPENIPKGKIDANEMPQIKITEKIKPSACWTEGEGILFDFGQNIAGFAQIETDAPCGSEIILEYSELITDDGKLSVWTNRNAQATDKYISAGKGIEIWHPLFTYHGFRYIMVTGIKNCRSFEISACVVGASVEKAGSFLCSDPMLNRIHKNILHGLKSNLYSIPTDCPQRDERTPCQMDSQAVEHAAILNFDMNTYYRKWLEDIADDTGNPDWSGDKFNALWYLYIYYNDIFSVKKYYKSCKAHIEKLEKNNPELIIKEGFGDWCNPNNNTWDSFFGCVTEVNTSIFYSMALRMSVFAELINQEKDAEYYLNLSKEIARKFIEKLYDKETGVCDCEKQTASILPLYYKILPPENKEDAVNYLVNKIKENGNRLDTGIFGTAAILEVLCKHGYADIAYSILKGSEYPSFGWQIANGATTTWEQWAYKGGMHSHNHAMFGGIDASFYNIFGGLEAIEPGFKKFRVKPIMPEGMDFIKFSYNSLCGMILFCIEKRSDGTEIFIEIPCNTFAEIYIPIENENDEFILFDGERTFKNNYEIIREIYGSYIKIDLPSGKYNIRNILKHLIYAE